MDIQQRLAFLEELIWSLVGGPAAGSVFHRQSSVVGGGDSGQSVTFAQSFLPSGSFTFIVAGITVTSSNAVDIILFELLRDGITFGAPTASRTGLIVGAELSFIDTTRPPGVLDNYSIRATNQTLGHTVTVVTDQAYLNTIDFG
jgi:hypothetical protein